VGHWLEEYLALLVEEGRLWQLLLLLLLPSLAFYRQIRVIIVLQRVTVRVQHWLVLEGPFKLGRIDVDDARVYHEARG